MSALIERLKHADDEEEIWLMRPALIAEIERLKSALERVANYESVHLSYVQVDEIKQIARAALEGEK